MQEMCRICLGTALQMHSVNISYKVNLEKTVSQVICECASIEVSEADSLPKFLCLKCYQQLIILNEFRQLIVTSDTQLRQQVSCAKYQYEDSVDLPDLNNEETDSVDQRTDSESTDFYPKVEVFIKEETLNEENGTKKRSENPTKGTQNQITTTKKPGRKPSKNPREKRKVHEFICEICNKVLYGRSNRLEQHILMAHSEVKNFACDVCDKKFKIKQQLVNHKRTHTGEKPYVCDVCRDTFTSPQNLHNHKKKHTGDNKPYKCETCEKSYSTPGELEVHKRIVHTGEKPYLCEICSRAYSSVRNLGLHKKSVHEKTEECPKCNIMLSIKRIRQHIQKHMDREEGVRRFTCDKCGKGFFTAFTLKKHQVVHTGERPYSCEICKKTFSQKSAVDTHKRVHSDIRGFSCEYCPKTFKYKQHLQLHMTKHHKEEEASFVRIAEVKPPRE